MSLSVRGQPVANAFELFERSQATDAVRYTNQLKEQMLTSLDNCEKMIGTIDATSCIGVCYQTRAGDVYVKHHDGRNLVQLVNLFDRKVFVDSEPVRVHLVGGCTEADKDGAFKSNRYDLLEQKHTKANFEGLVAFWKGQGYKIDVQGWAVGEAKTNETLCSDFIADKDSIRLVKPGVAVSKGLVPEIGRRMNHAVDSDRPYVKVYDNSQSEELVFEDATSGRQRFKSYGKQIRFTSDRDILAQFSTTPQLEPPHFVRSMREWGAFLDSENPLPAKRIAALKPVIILQGEIGLLHSQPKPEKTVK